jgi:hypothetical protein
MNRGLFFAVGYVVAVVVGLTGCSHGQQRVVKLPAVGPTGGPVGTGAKPGNAPGSTVADGQQLNIQGGLCRPTPPGVNISLWGPDQTVAVNVQLGDDSDTPEVQSVTIGFNGKTIGYTSNAVMFDSHAQATKDGSTYKITGSGWAVYTSTTKPFEITAKC